MKSHQSVGRAEAPNSVRCSQRFVAKHPGRELPAESKRVSAVAGGLTQQRVWVECRRLGNLSLELCFNPLTTNDKPRRLTISPSLDFESRESCPLKSRCVPSKFEKRGLYALYALGATWGHYPYFSQLQTIRPTEVLPPRSRSTRSRCGRSL